MQYNQGPEYYWHTFTDTLRTLNISLVHLIRRDTLRAEISYYFLNHPNRSCLPSKSAKTLFQNAVFREGEIERFQTLVRKMKGVRRIEVDYEEVLKDKENLRPVYKFLGLEPPPAGADAQESPEHAAKPVPNATTPRDGKTGHADRRHWRCGNCQPAGP